MKTNITAVLAYDNSAWNRRPTKPHHGHILLLVYSRKVIQQRKLLASAARTRKRCAALVELCYDLLSECAHSLGWISLKIILPNDKDLARRALDSE